MAAKGATKNGGVAMKKNSDKEFVLTLDEWAAVHTLIRAIDAEFVPGNDDKDNGRYRLSLCTAFSKKMWECIQGVARSK